MRKHILGALLALSLLGGGAQAQPKSLTQLGAEASLYINCEGTDIPAGTQFDGPLVVGKWGTAVLCEPALQNLIANPEFSAGLENWFAIGAPQVQQETVDGATSRFIQCTPGNVVRQPVLQLPAASAVYCLSFYARAVSDNAQPLASVRIGGQDIALDETQSRPLGHEWERRTLIFTSDKAPILGPRADAATRAANATLTLGATAGTVQIGRVQLEASGFATSFTPLKRRNSLISVSDLNGRLNPLQGTITLWLAPQWAPGDHGGSTLFNWNAGVPKPNWQYDILNLHHSYKGAWGAGFVVHAGDDAGLAIHPFAPDPMWQRQNWHHVAFTWELVPGQTSRIGIYLDGLLVKDEDSEKKLGLRVAGERITFGGGDGYYANAALDEIAAFTRVLSGDEIKLLAEAATPLK